MKATLKQWIFLGVFTAGTVMSFGFWGYREVAPSSPNRSLSESPDSEGKSNIPAGSANGSRGWRVSYPVVSTSPRGPEAKEGSTGKGEDTSADRSSPATAGKSSFSPSSRPASILDKSKLVTYSLDDYLTIADLDPFRPVSPEPKPKPATVSPSSPSRNVPLLPAPVIITKPLPVPRQAPPSQESSLPSSGSPSPPVLRESLPEPQAPSDVAVTGYVQAGKGWLILMEDVKTQEGRMVGLGEEGFGYWIKSLDVAANQLVLEKNGQEFRLKLGDNKKDFRPPPKASPPQQGNNPNPAEGSPSPSDWNPGGSPDW